MGDGMWHMLGIALSVVRAQGGVLLIDEIDTGLHYSVMGDMWRLVHDAAKRLDVQVFAATHSRDCYQSLAAIVEAGAASRPEVTIQRIERGNPRAVAFTDDEIRIAAEIGAEVR
jgi:predicted ATPase